MRLGPSVLLLSLIFGSAAPAVALTRAHRGPTSPRTGKHTSKPKLQGQRTIDDERATQIQSALVRSGYLTGGPSGHWDAETQAAMEKLQADNGWQTKLCPTRAPSSSSALAPAPPQATHSQTSPRSLPPAISIQSRGNGPSSLQPVIASKFETQPHRLRCRISFVRGLKKTAGTGMFLPVPAKRSTANR